MKISILVHDLSSNSLVRTYPIAKVLERHYQIEVIGPVFGKEIFKPYQDEFDYKPVRAYCEGSKLKKIKKRIFGINGIADVVTGDIIYAFKPMYTSLGVGLLSKRRKQIPLILDIEDWDAAHFHEDILKNILISLKRFYEPSNGLYNALMETQTKKANDITVVSKFLQNRFGGIKLPHGADVSFFDPAMFDKKKNRTQWNFKEEKIIMFCGTPIPHKGLEELIEAINIINRNDIKLMIVGGGKESLYVDNLIFKSQNTVIVSGYQPHSKMPELLSMADMIVLPQRKTLFSTAQVPGKVFEAMAMAKPIIASNISDLPEILDGCGWIVEPENPEQLAEKILYVLNNPEEAEEVGNKARQKCIEKYSWDVMEEILLRVFKKYE